MPGSQDRIEFGCGCVLIQKTVETGGWTTHYPEECAEHQLDPVNNLLWKLIAHPGEARLRFIANRKGD